MGLFFKKNTTKPKDTIIIVSLSYLILLLLWALFTYTNVIKPLILPQPHVVFLELVKLFVSGKVIPHLIITVLRLIIGFVISLLLAIPIGTYIGLSKKGKSLFNPLLILRYLPYSALIPLSILWFGLGEFQKIFILVIANVTFLTMLVADKVSRVPIEFVETACTLGAKNRDVIKKVILPRCAPLIYDDARLVFAVGWVIIIVVEMIGAESGLGHMIIEAQRYLQTPRVIAGVIIIGVIGFCADYLFNCMYKIFFPWSEKGGT